MMKVMKVMKVMMVMVQNISCTSRQVYRQVHISPAELSCTVRRGRSTAGGGCSDMTETAAAWPPGDTQEVGRLLDCTPPGTLSRTSGWALGRTAAGEHLGISPVPPPAPLAGRTDGGWRNISDPPLAWEHSHTSVW